MVYTAETTKEKEKTNSYSGWLITLLVVGLVVVIFFIITLIVKVPYTAMVTYTESEPYETQEAYTEKEPYIATECEDFNLKYIIDWGTSESICTNNICTRWKDECVEWLIYNLICNRYQPKCVMESCTKYQKTCRLNIKNIDDTSGVWGLSVYSVNNNQEFLIGTRSAYIQPTETKTISWSFSYDPGESTSCTYKDISVPKKTICEDVTRYEDITKYRTITKYKEVQKERGETRYRTLFEEWFG